MIRAGLVVLLLLVFSQQIRAEETPHFAFVAEYVRELGANEAARATGERELAEMGANSLAAGIRASTRIMLELRSQIGLLKNMSLKPPFEEVPANLSKFYAMKIERHERLVEISSVILSGPQPGGDYGTWKSLETASGIPVWSRRISIPYSSAPGAGAELSRRLVPLDRASRLSVRQILKVSSTSMGASPIAALA